MAANSALLVANALVVELAHASEEALEARPPADRNVQPALHGQREAYALDHPEQFFVVYRPPQAVSPPRLAVLVHGGFWKAEYSVENALTPAVAQALLRRGWYVVDVEYRRVGHEGGGWPRSNADVLSALSAIRARLGYIMGGDTLPARVALFGHSAGGQLAIWAAHHAATARGGSESLADLGLSDVAREALVVDLVVAVAPVSDLVEAARARLSDEGDSVQRYLGGDPLQDGVALLAAQRASPVAACAPCLVPTLVACGQADTDVPPAIALCYGREGDPLVAQMPIDGADHYSVFDGQSSAFLQIVTRAEACLARAAQPPRAPR
ncbi:Alpha/Beta hydrolase protein [Pavlovales sp. CCMP2436]|nr:Alpha/Beta hydrolase protein [Pavlovales sp. CCMP2436]